MSKEYNKSIIRLWEGEVMKRIISLCAAVMLLVSLAGFSLAETAIGKIQIIKNKNVTVRSIPSTKGEAVGTALSNDEYDLLEIDEKWYKIQLHNGKSGWITSSAAKISKMYDNTSNNVSQNNNTKKPASNNSSNYSSSFSTDSVSSYSQQRTSFVVPLATTEQEILFRNIPWGTSATELEKQDFIGFSSFYDSSMPFQDSFTVEPTWRKLQGNSTDFNAGLAATCYTWNGQVKVAGYETSNIHLYCAYSLEGNNLLKEKSNSRFFAADYVFDPLDYQYAYNTLAQKLTDLYGEGTNEHSIEKSWMAESGHSDDIEIEMNITTWNGANDTHVVIVGAWIVDEEKFADNYSSNLRNMMKTLFIAYYKGGMDEELHRISDLEQQLEIAQEQQGVEGNDGL